VAGIEKKSRVLNKQERRRVAYHEMGHALVAASLPGVDPVQKVSFPAASVHSVTPCSGRPKTVFCRRKKRRAHLEAGVDLLIARETLTAEQFAPLRSSGAATGALVAAGMDENRQ